MNAKPFNNRRLRLRWISALFFLMAGLPSLSRALPRIVARTGQLPRRQITQVLVKFRMGAMAGRSALSAGGWVAKSEIAGIGVQVVEIPATKSADDVIQDLKARHGADLEYAEPDHARYAVSIPNDPAFSSEYHLAKISCPAAWDLTTGAGVIIAIADTGVLTTHADLAAHLLPGFNTITGTSDVTDTVGHGTAVAGSAAAVGNNAIGVVGVAYDARILPIKISNDGSSNDSLIAAAIVYAANHGAKVVNVSFNDDTPAPVGCWSQTVIDAATYMQSRGGLVVVAAGNAGIDKRCPNIPELINVAATDQNDQLASFSNFGLEIDISAPGVGIITTGNSGGYVIADGTSFAAPITAGVLGLIYSINTSLTSAQAQHALFTTATDLGPIGFDSTYGWGRVNAQKAVSSGQLISAAPAGLDGVYAYPNPWDARKDSLRQITITNPGVNLVDGTTVKIFTLSGFWVKTLTAANGKVVWQDLTNDSGERVASGLYFYLATSGDSQVKGTLAIIK